MSERLRLEARGLTIGVGRGRQARTLVRGLELVVEPGSVTALVGPNGSGKTTLLRTLLGLHPARAGELLLHGRPLSELGLRERARACAWLPQRTELPWGMPVHELVLLGRAPHLSALAGPGPQDRAKVEEALARVAASSLAQRNVRTLSGGELQRVLLARLLATDAPLLILDEPTSALDVGHALSLLELTRELAQAGHGLLMAIHDLEFARRYADQALLLRGDDAASWISGPAKEILGPKALTEVFGVEVHLVGEQLRFSPGQ